VIVILTLTTAYIHSTLGGLLFTLNAIGYAALAVMIIVTAAVPAPIVHRLRWVPRVALGGYALVTIGGYLVIGPYFLLGWTTKAIEVALLVGLAVLVRWDHGGIRGLVAEARASASWALRSFRRVAPDSAEVAPREA
jgi:hypothetical protein